MPSILSRFKRSPSRSSNQSDGSDEQSHTRTRSSSSVVPLGTSTETPEPTSPSTSLPRSGSLFIEDLPAGHSQSPSRPQDIITPDRSTAKHKPTPLSVPNSGIRPALGTPKLVLTEEGASPRSVEGSPIWGHSPTPASGQTSGLGLGDIPRSEGIVEAPTMSRSNSATNAEMLREQLDEKESRRRSGSIFSEKTRHSRSGSIVTRLANAAGKTTSPNGPTGSLRPSGSRRSSMSGKKSKKSKRGKKERSKSTSSGVSGPNASIAAALAKSGMQIASPAELDLAAEKRRSTNRSPWLVRGSAAEYEAYHREGDDESRMEYDDDEYDDEEDETDSDLDVHLPVTGFAVASNRRQQEFHHMFPSVDEGDYLIEDYGCALSKDILVQGRIYVSENHLCFHANIFGWVTDLVIPFMDIRTIDKKMTALVIPNAIGVVTATHKYTFASFISRDSTYDVMMNIWRLCNPNAVMSTPSFALPSSSRPTSFIGEVPADAAPVKGHAKTECACGKEGKHYPEIALDTTFHSTPEKVFNLMFNSEWYKRFLDESQKLKDVEMSDWKPTPETKNLSRSISYIKPLNGSIGPKQTKCYITDEHQCRDFDQYVSMLTTTKTPDVPSGGVFSVKTRTCITWAGPRSTRVLVTTTVEWTGKSWVKGIIEKSAIEGQKQYHDDLEKGMKAYMKEHAGEFAVEGAEDIDDEIVEEETKPTEAAAYAAQQRKERQDKDYWLIQGGLDSVVSGVKAVGSGVQAVIGATVDVVSPSFLTKETLTGLVIIILVLSNIYTYYAFRSSNLDIQVRRATRVGYKNEEVENAVRAILREERRLDPLDEARALKKALDDIEDRFKRLQSGLRQTGMNDLD